MANAPIRVGVSGHNFKFWMPLQRALEATGRYEFRHDQWRNHDGHDLETSLALVEWADVLVSEWALGSAVWYSMNKRPGQRLVVRWHRQELETRFPPRIAYDNVDAIAFVGPHILRQCVEKFSIPPGICTVIGNLIDVDKLSMPKMGDADTTIGIVGISPAMKRLDLAVDTLEHLLKHDARYKLRVKGASPATLAWLWRRPDERKYFEGVYTRINEGPLRYKVIFDPHGADIPTWLKLVGTVLSPSDFESFHMALAEGAASGAYPICWEREGATEIFPEFPLVASAEEAADRILMLNRSATGARLRQQAREMVRDRYDAPMIARQWSALLEGGSDDRLPQVPLAGRDVLVVWAIDNWPTFHRSEMLRALAANIADHCDVLIVEPGNHLETIESRGWAPRAELDRMASEGMVHEAANIYRTRLFTGGVGVSQATTNQELADETVAHCFPNARKVLHWVYKPDQAHRLGQRPFVYEVYDDYTIGFGSGAFDESVARLEAAILPLARHVFFTSRPLMERKSALARSASLVGNGVDYDAFALRRLEPAPRTGRPAAGYLGNLADFFDWDLMEAVCAALPEVDFFFHGQLETKRLGDRTAILERMRAMPNVRFSGRVNRPRGAASVNRYDVLLIPFVVNAAMHAVNPLKLWEYFATGLPVVSTPMEAIEHERPALVIAEGVQAWVDAIRTAIDEQDPALRTLRIGKAQAHQWSVLTREHAKALAPVFATMQGPAAPVVGMDATGAPA